MRQGPNSRRTRGRSGSNGANSNNRRPNLPNRNQTFDSNGPDVRIRGNALQVHEKYQTLARDAAAAGDRVTAENYLQHAEHYHRIILEMNEAHRQATQDMRDSRDHRQANGRARDDGHDEAADGENRHSNGRDSAGNSAAGSANGSANSNGREPHRPESHRAESHRGESHRADSNGRGDGGGRAMNGRGQHAAQHSNGGTRGGTARQGTIESAEAFGADPRHGDERDGEAPLAEPLAGSLGGNQAHPSVADTAEAAESAPQSNRDPAELGADQAADDATEPRVPRRRRGAAARRRISTAEPAAGTAEGWTEERADTVPHE